MRKKIGIDFTYIKKDEVSGIRKSGEELLDGLTRINNKYEIVLFIDSDLEKSFNKKYPQYKKISIKVPFKKNRYLRAFYNRTIDKYYKKYCIKKEKCDLMLYPYVDAMSPTSKKIVSLQSILDIIPLDIIENKKSFRYIRKKRQYINMMNKTNNIVTISKYSKDRLLDINPKYDGNIFVIPTSVEKLNRNSKTKEEILKSSNKYIFSINSFLKHKNQITLVKAFQLIKDKIEYDLVLVGRPEIGSRITGYQEVMDYIKENKLDNRVKVLSFISDEERNALFYNSELFVTPSMQEGFGRTPVEAAMCRIPVISTRETSLPEATMEKVFYYSNPTDEKELAEKILYVLKNRPSDEELEKIAILYEREYDVDEIAKKYMNLIDEILKEK